MIKLTPQLEDIKTSLVENEKIWNEELEMSVVVFIAKYL